MSITRETIFSPDKLYRYTLWREFGGELLWEGVNHQKQGFVQWIGLNPSVADDVVNDNTIRRCMAFTKKFGYGAMCMTNLFAWRATDPADMRRQKDPVGPDNNMWLVSLAGEASLIICAWGNHGAHMGRAQFVLNILKNGPPLYRLGEPNADGSPRHPLYLKETLTPAPL